MIDHSTTTLFAFLGKQLRFTRVRDMRPADDEPRSPTPVRLDAERDRLQPRDEGFYWAWQYWSQ
ncbi:hypothetical protein LHFGNBLO_001021 [Mesorhizobium sp. AR10]|uniref:hypothetical protein n=1 Tax=Mesorhizobium sp. AR10 TaxID=2865839 RepID=UPI00215EF968|nr:hypothetical protein [Mesorhizobium sp. AR10]UVK41780.1 hypothetical protein LHFGNBLO_001021 [Mesorhizobium sp. AR10]